MAEGVGCAVCTSSGGGGCGGMAGTAMFVVASYSEW
jgi:hypothetical protein